MTRPSWLGRLGSSVCVVLASGFLLSYLPVKIFRGRRWSGSGFIGTAWGLVAAFFMPENPVRLLFTLIGIFLLSVVISDEAERVYAQKDDGRIVIDEFIGYLVGVAFLPHTLPILLAGFVAFRFFDVFKISVVNRCQDLPGGWGVVVDDVMAGVLANITLRIGIYVVGFFL